MRSILFFALIFALTGCSRSENDTPGTDAVPILHLPILEEDLGQIALPSELLRVRVPLLNRGTADLKVLEVQPSCTCTDVEVLNSVIGGGGSSELQVIIDPNRGGSTQAQIVIVSNDSRRPTSSVTIRWQTRPPVNVEPHEVDFGDVKPNEVKRCRLTLSQVPGTTANVTAVNTTTPDLLTTRTDDTIELEVRAGATAGKRYEIVRLSIGSEEEVVVSVPVRWQVVTDVFASPPAIFLGSGAPGSAYSKSIVLRGTRDFTVESAESSGLNEGSSQVEQRSARVIVLRLTGRYPVTGGAFNGNLQVTFGMDSRTGLVNVPVSGYSATQVKEVQQ